MACLAVLMTCLNTTSVQAQSVSEKKMDALISALDETKFIQEYKEFKNETESKIAEIKLHTELDAQAVAKLKIEYNKSKFKFDAITDQLKRDLSNSATRKLIVKSPTTFSDAYQKKLDDAKSYCSNNFHEKADALLKKPDGSMDAATLELLVGSFFTIFKSINEKKKAEDEFNATYLETQFIEPLRFKAWDKIQ